MARDYAKARGNQSKKKKNITAPSRLRWFIAGFLSCVLILVAWFAVVENKGELKQQSAAVFAKLQKKKTTLHTTIKESEKPKPRQPKFDFYEMLPEMGDEPRIATKPEIEPDSQQHYIVQAASFHRSKDADRLKAELVLAGFDVKVKESQQSGQFWYRVILGPYKSHNQALQIEKELKQQGINSLVITERDHVG